MTKEQIEELLEDAKDFGFSLNIEQYNEGNGILIKNVYQLKENSKKTSSNIKPMDTETTDSESALDVTPYPPSQFDDILFRKELVMPAVKAELGRLTEEEKSERDLNIAHWLVVWRVFCHFGFFEIKQSQTTFIKWVADVFGWKWKTKKFAGEFIPVGIKDRNLDEWSLDNICSQRPQAELYLTWKNKLVDAFIEEKNGRQDCKQQFYTRWFNTKRSR